MDCKGICLLCRIRCIHQFQNAMPSVLKILGQEEPLRPCFASLQLRNPVITEKASKRHFPICTSSSERSFQLHTVAVVLFCQLDICLVPALVASPSHNVLPVPSAFGIIRAACHLPSCNLHSFHSQILDPGLIMFLQLLCHLQSCSLHVINPALIWSSSRTQNTSKFTQLPRAQRLEHTLCESPFSSTMMHLRYTSRVKCGKESWGHRRGPFSQRTKELPFEFLCHILVSEQPRLSNHVPSASIPSVTCQIYFLPLLLTISMVCPGLY